MQHVVTAHHATGAGSSLSRSPWARRGRWGTGVRGQRGGFGLGLIVGLVIGLALALGVALYITKAPMPFVNKVPQRSAEQDAAEAQRNKNWDPNAPLASKVPRPVPPAAEEPASGPAAAGAAASAPAATGGPGAGQAAASPARNPAAILAGQGPAAGPAAAVPAPGPAKAAKAAEPYTYFVQAGAFQRPDDAEAQRARLTMMGLEPRVLEREQGGRAVYRVRLGPFDKQADAEALREKLATTGMEAALVRMERPPQ
ncbi:MAG: SPOR domain-containing protein [Rubrivivax sp.]|jgi:cell division protein FtsN